MAKCKTLTGSVVKGLSYISGIPSLKQLLTMFDGSTFYLDTAYFQWHVLHVNKLMLFSTSFSIIIWLLLLVCFKVRMSQISRNTGNFLLNHSDLFCGPLFIRTQCRSFLLFAPTLCNCSFQVTFVSISSQR